MKRHLICSSKETCGTGVQSNCILSAATQHQVYCLTQGETDTRRHRLINSRSETTNMSSRLSLALSTS